jgi:SAM-dependent methyltransferase
MKRADLLFDTKHFEKKQIDGKRLSTEDTFQEIYQTNHWESDASFSGIGSGGLQTREISLQIPRLVKELEIKDFLDVPCGDFGWFSKLNLNLESYVGGDILAEIVERNQKIFNAPGRQFKKINLITDPLPDSDILLCRDCLVHLSNEDINAVIQNIKRSNITYLLTTTFPDCDLNEAIVTGDWRIINLEKAPFNFPLPIKLINEKCSEGNGAYADKSLGFWKVSDL